MQRLTWDVMRDRAKEFAADWSDATYEKGETQSFYNAFFDIFGVKRRSVASYEKRVQTLDKSRAGFIDLFWPGTLLVEQKSAGLDLGKARGQALDYVDWLRDRDQPRYVLTCDFQRWRRSIWRLTARRTSRCRSYQRISNGLISSLAANAISRRKPK